MDAWGSEKAGDFEGIMIGTAFLEIISRKNSMNLQRYQNDCFQVSLEAVGYRLSE